nr:Ig-like domain-containing protein [Pseudomonas sp. FFPRI_1]
MNFAFINDRNTLYFYPMSEQSTESQPIQAMDGARYIVTQQDNASLADHVLTQRIDNDLHLNLSNAPSSAVVVKDFFLTQGSLHSLHQNGEYRLQLSSSAGTLQGAVTLMNAEPVVLQDQPEAAFLHSIQRQATLQTLHEAVEAQSPSAVDGPEPQNAEAMITTFGAEARSSAQPGINSILDRTGEAIGDVTNFVTDERFPLFQGGGTPGSTLLFLQNGEPIDIIEVGPDGQWSYVPGTTTLDGAYIFSVMDMATGNVLGSPVSLLVDGTSPTRSFIDKIMVGDTVLESGESIGNVAPVLSGVTERQGVVTIFEGNRALLSIQAKMDGSWSVEIPLALLNRDGQFDFRIEVTDFVGNVSQVSPPYSINLDRVPPPPPIIDDVQDMVGAVQGSIASGSVTDDPQPTLSGTAEKNAFIYIYDGNTVIGETKADINGNWSITLTAPLSDASHSLTVRAKDAVGNLSDPSAPWILIVDTTLPETPVLGGDGPGISEVIDDFGPVTGSILNGGETDDRTPTLKGTGKPGDTMIIRNGTTIIGSVTIENADGSWSFTPESELPDGEYAFNVIIKTPSGNESAPSAEWVVKVDSTTRPDAPSIDGSGPGLNEVIDNFGPVTGPVLNGGETDDLTPTLNGSGNPGDTVIIRDKGEVIGEVVIDEDGKWTFTPDLEEGEHKLDIIIQDEIGRQSDPSPEFVIKIDTTPPTDPVLGDEGYGLHEIIDDAGEITGPIAENGITDDNTPTFKGTGVVGDTVIIRNGNEEIGRVVITEADGSWSFTPETELADGNYAFNVVMQNPAGNQSNPSPSWNVEIDTVAPSDPVLGDEGYGLHEIIDDAGEITGPIAENGITDDTTPTFKGTGVVGDTVIIRNGNEEIGRVVITEADGSWSFTPETELADGNYAFNVVMQDPAGNQSNPSPSWNVEIDTVAPSDPVLGDEGHGLHEIIDDAGEVTGPIAENGVTDDTTPTFKGTGVVGDTVIIRNGNEEIGRVVITEADGSWSFTPETELADGNYAFNVIMQNPLGNQSQPSPNWNVEIDTVAPSDPVLGDEGHGLHEIIDDAGEVTGPIAENGVTDDNTPTFKGTGVVGDTVIIRNGSEEIGRVVITEADGSWSFTPETALADGNYAFNVVMQDPAGNPSNPSPSWNVEIDTVAPSDPVLGDEGYGLHEIIDDAGEVTGPIAENGITDDSTPTFKGTGVVGDTVIIRNGNEEIGRVVITEADGSWSFTPETELADGNYAFNVVMQNPLGIQSKPSPNWNVEIDTVAPSDPVLGDEGHGLHEIIDDAGEVTGPIAENGVTDDNTPTFKGTGVVGDTVIIRNGSEEIGRVVITEADGSWSFTPETELADGNYAFNVVMQNPAGNQSNPSPSWNVEIDTVAPSDPVLGDEGYGLHEIIDDAGEITGPIAENGITDDTTPTFKGTGVVGDTVIIRNGNEEIGRVVITEADGSWSFTPETELADGNYAFNVVMQDPAGNQSNPSPSWNVEIDTVAPSDPVLGDEGHGLHEIIDDAGEVTGPIAENGVTDDTTPTFKGTGVVGDTVIIRNGNEEIGRVVITEADGSWSFTPETELADGNYAFNVIMQNPLGNQSQPSPNWNVEIDTVAPSDPVLGDEGHGLHEIIDDAGEVTGPIAENGVTDDNTPTFKGTGVVGDTVIIRNGSEEIGRVVITEADGSWSFTPETELADGNYAFNVVMQNPAGNQSNPSPSWNVEIDTVAPSDPVLGDEGYGLHEIIDDAGEITGPIAENGITDDTTPTFKGTGVVGDTVIIRNGNEEIGRVVITEADGSWSFTPETELADGNYAFNVVMQDPAGNQSNPSPSWNVEIDTVAPSDPVLGDEGHGLHEIIDDAGEVTGPIAENGVTDDTTPTFKGTGVVGDTVIIRNGNEEIGRVVITEADGSWSFTPETELADGNYAFNVIMQNPLGNQSQPSPNWNVEIDTVAPSDPVLGDEGHGLHEIIDDAGEVTGPIAENGVTDDNTPTFKGTGVVGDTVIIRNGSEEIGRVVITEADGSWSFTPETALADGNYAFNVVMQDPAGNPSNPSPSWNVEIDTVAPSDPVLGDEGHGLHEIIDDAGEVTGPIAENGVTDDTTPTFKGTGVVGDTVIIRNGNEEIGRMVITEADGSWSFTPETELADGNYAFNVIMQNPLGNQSKPSPSWNVEIDTVAPSDPVLGDEGHGLHEIIDDAGSITGPIAEDGITDDNTPTFKGTGVVGDTVIIRNGSEEIGRVVITEADGSWSFTPETELADGNYAFNVVMQDPAGNQSKPSPSWNVEINSQGQPETPTIESVFDDIGTVTGNLTSGDVTDDNLPRISGKTEPGNRVMIYDHGQPIGEAEVDQDGKWSFIPETELNDGEHSFTAVAINGAGTRSDASTAFDMIIYTGNGPSQVAKLLHMGKDSGMDGADFVTNNGSAGRLMYGELSGALEAGQRLQVSTDGGRTWSDALVNGTQWAMQDKAAHSGSWSIQTRVLDVDGNSGYVMKQSVTFDNSATRPAASASFAGTELVIDLPTSSLNVGDRVVVFGERGAQYFEHILTQEDLLAGSVRMEVGALSSASVALVDAAGNMSNWTNVNIPVPPNATYIVTGEESEIYGTNGRADVYQVSDLSLLDKVKLIEGNGGIDTLRLTGSDQVLDLSQLKTRLSSIENFDITGTGDNTLKLSLGDVLEQGATGMYISSNSIQVAVRGDAGDVVQLSDLLPNGMDGGSWVHNSRIIASGITYEVYHNSTMNADLLVEAGVTVQMV